MDVEIWSDIACPWCAIGQRRFERALAEFEHRDEVRTVWRSFELDPQAPAERFGDRAERLAAKYGITVEAARDAERRLVEAAAGEGLRFRFDIARSGSTFDAHRLVHLAQEHGLGDAMKRRLLRAHFEEGRLVSDPATLRELGAEVGLADDEVATMLAGERYREAVIADERAAAGLGVSGVPTFIIGRATAAAAATAPDPDAGADRPRAVGVSGAQDPTMLLALLRRGWELQPAAV